MFVLNLQLEGPRQMNLGIKVHNLRLEECCLGNNGGLENKGNAGDSACPVWSMYHARLTCSFVHSRATLGCMCWPHRDSVIALLREFV